AGMQTLLRLAWIGFTLNAISGVALFTSDAVHFFSSYTFRIKLVLLALGGLDAAFVTRKIFPDSRAESSGEFAVEADAPTKALAAASLAFWIGAVIAGRLIAYTPWRFPDSDGCAGRARRHDDRAGDPRNAVDVSGFRDDALYRARDARRRHHADRPAAARLRARLAAATDPRPLAVGVGRFRDQRRHRHADVRLRRDVVRHESNVLAQDDADGARGCQRARVHAVDALGRLDRVRTRAWPHQGHRDALACALARRHGGRALDGVRLS